MNFERERDTIQSATGADLRARISEGQTEKAFLREPETKAGPEHVWGTVGPAVAVQVSCPIGPGHGAERSTLSSTVDGWVCLGPGLAGVGEIRSVGGVRR